MIRAFRAFAAACRRVEDSWIGDLIGVVSLFALLWLTLLAGAALEVPR